MQEHLWEDGPQVLDLETINALAPSFQESIYSAIEAEIKKDTESVPKLEVSEKLVPLQPTEANRESH